MNQIGRTFDPGPDAFMIRLCTTQNKIRQMILHNAKYNPHTFNTSAGEHTVVATVPYNNTHQLSSTFRDHPSDGHTYRRETRSKMTRNIVFKILGLEQLGFEEIVRRKLAGVHQDGSEDVGSDTAS